MIYYIALTLAFVVVGYRAYQGDCLGPFIAVVVLGFGVVSCNRSSWWVAYEQEREMTFVAEAKAAAIPHKVSEADGCTVYVFTASHRLHYFTRCDKTTTTTNDYSKSCGKSCTKTEENDITTENKK